MIEILDTELKRINKEIVVLSKDRKFYKKQSEFHRMMYALTLKLEITQDNLDKLC